MLEILTKPIIIGSISIPFLIIITLVIIISAIFVLMYLYAIENKKKAEECPPPKKQIIEQISKEEKHKKEIEKLKRSLPYLSKKEASNKFIKIIRAFFKDLLELNYEFTFEELAEELKKRGRHKGLIAFSEKVSDLKYRKGDISKKELLILCRKFEDILNYEAIPEVKKIERKGLFLNLWKRTIPHVRKPPVNNQHKNS